jgi:hypothetical protein
MSTSSLQLGGLLLCWVNAMLGFRVLVLWCGWGATRTPAGCRVYS